MKFMPFDQDRFNVSLAKRMKAAERRLATPNRPVTEEVAVFSVVGDMEVRTSGRYPVRTGGQVVAVRTTVDGAGSADTEFDILHAGVALGSGVVIDDAEADGQTDYLGDYRIPAGSYLQLDITQAGMHPNMVVAVVMKG